MSNLKQVTKDYKIEIRKDEKIDIRLLSRWFDEFLNLDKEEFFEDEIKNICNFALILNRKLSQISLIPIFYKGKIKEILVEKKKITIILSLTYIDLIEEDFFYKILYFSINYIFWMMKNEPSSENIKYFSNVCVSEIINPILKTQPPGKSKIPILQEVFNKNIPFIHIGNGIYQLGWGNKSKKIDRSTTNNDSAIGLHLSQNKITTVNLLKLAGFPTSNQIIVKTKEELLEAVKKLKFPVVVKPINLDRGEGVTVDINEENKLIWAFENVINLSGIRTVIVEKQVNGICHRLFVSSGKLLYCVKRLPIGLKADGMSTIEQLINSANNKESKKIFWEEKTFFPKDSFSIEILKKTGYFLDSIPLKNTWIELRDIESTQWGGRDEDMTNFVHPDNLDLAIRVSKLFELEVVGIDIITTDISKSWMETNSIINEINYAPLLGGAEISKTYIKTFIDRFIQNDGRIPVEIFIGNCKESLIKAKETHQKYLEKGLKCYLTNHESTFNENLNQINLLTNSLENRIKALLLNSNVEALIIIIQNSEFLYKVFPLDKVDKINLVSKEIEDLKTNKNLDEKNFKLLINKFS